MYNVCDHSEVVSDARFAIFSDSKMIEDKEEILNLFTEIMNAMFKKASPEFEKGMEDIPIPQMMKSMMIPMLAQLEWPKVLSEVMYNEIRNRLSGDDS